MTKALKIVAVLLLATPTGGCTGGEPPGGEEYVIAGGDTTGIYYGYGRQLAGAMSAELDVTVTTAETQGSVDNLRRVARGQALLGFAQSDTTADAVAGVGAFEDEQPIAGVARVYDEYVHLVVRAESGIERVADLSGHTVSLGAEQSGTEVIAGRLLAAAGVDMARVDNPELGIAKSIMAMRRGDIEAFFWVGGLPTPGISDLTDDGTPIRLLPVGSDVVERVNARHAGVYRMAEVPAGVYGTSNAVRTMAVPNYLVTSKDAPAALIHDAVAVLFDSRLEIAGSIPVAALLDRREAIFTEPAELHPGAAAYYQESRR